MYYNVEKGAKKIPLRNGVRPITKKDYNKRKQFK